MEQESSTTTKTVQKRFEGRALGDDNRDAGGVKRVWSEVEAAVEAASEGSRILDRKAEESLLDSASRSFSAASTCYLMGREMVAVGCWT